MREYTLFVDTETSGIPRNWDLPYSTPNNWPHVAQLAWVICTRDGREVKAENHYILPSDYDLTPESGQIHGLTVAFLQAYGRSRHEVMQLLYQDLLEYQPLVVGHFMQLDFHMLGVSFYRAGLPNPLGELPNFCTMRLTGKFMRPEQQSFLRLGELYERLFHEPMTRHHDALIDAQATARCFYELTRQGLISEMTLATQKQVSLPAAEGSKESGLLVMGWLAIAALFVLLALATGIYLFLH